MNRTLAACLLALAFSVRAHAGPDCKDWNSLAFIEVAKFEDINRCLHAGANLDARTEGGFTPLHWAAVIGTAETINALLNAGADFSAKAARGMTSLHWAAIAGTAETVNALLDAGADANARDENGDTPFDFAVDNKKLKNTDAYWRLNEARFK